VAPGIPDLAEHAYFEDLGQADEALIHDRDRRLGVSTSQKRRNRADIPTPAVASGANSWESGRTVQTRLEEMDFQRSRC
jgi:hypothetical protein